MVLRCQRGFEFSGWAGSVSSVSVSLAGFFFFSNFFSQVSNLLHTLLPKIYRNLFMETCSLPDFELSLNIV